MAVDTCSSEVPELKIDPPSVTPCPHLPTVSISPGIFPYLGGSASADQLRSVVAACRGAIVSGKQGAKLAAGKPGVLVDPAVYGLSATIDSEPLFDYDDWLTRQQAAGVPLILTDTPRIRIKDRPALRKALERWATIDKPTLVVLPIEPWWLREGLLWLTEEVREADRPVAIVLLHRYNGFDVARTVSGLLTFIRDVEPLPVVLLRCDISAVGAVAHRAFAGFVGWSANTRHGPLPMRRPDRAEDDDERASPRRCSCPRCTATSRQASFPCWLGPGYPTCCAVATQYAAVTACCGLPSSARSACRPVGNWQAGTTWPSRSRSRAAFSPPPSHATRGGKRATRERR